MIYRVSSIQIDWANPEPILYQVNPVDPIILPGTIITPMDQYTLYKKPFYKKLVLRWAKSYKTLSTTSNQLSWIKKLVKDSLKIKGA